MHLAHAAAAAAAKVRQARSSHHHEQTVSFTKGQEEAGLDL
jgi:hypothetical protein